MAFRELSEKDLELLTDSQRKAYEEELTVYRERVRFVEQLEKMENTQIEPYQPKLDPISPIKKAPEKHFIKSEHSIQKIRVAAKPIPKVRSVKSDPISEPLLPKHSRPASVCTASVQKMEVAALDLPARSAARIPRSGIKAMEPVKADIQNAAKVQIPAAKQIRTETVQVTVEPAEKLKFKTPEKRTFEKVAVKPCRVPVCSAKVDVPNMAESTTIQAKLPQTAVSFTNAREYHIPTPELTALPETAAIRCADISYVRPDVSAAEVNPVSIPAIPRRKHKTVAAVRSEVPAVVKPKAKVAAYAAPVIQKPVSPVRVQPVRVSEQTFKPVARTAPRMVQPEPVHIPGRTFNNRGYSVQAVPKAAPVLIPDPHSNEVIHALLRNAK